MLEHPLKSLPQQIQILLREARVRSQMWRNEPMRHVQPVRHDLFSAHGALFFEVTLVGDSHPRDRLLQRRDRIHRTSKRELHRPANLSAVDLCRHDRAEHANVKERLTHPRARLIDLPSLLGTFRVSLEPQRAIGLLVLTIQYRLLFDVNVIARFTRLGKADEIANLPFQTNVRDKAVSRLWIDARRVASVRVAVWIAVDHIEQKNEVIASRNWVAHN